MKLTELIEIDILQKIQDSFSKFTGMASITTNPEGAPITVGSGFSEFCMKYTRNGSVLGNRRCEACDKKRCCVYSAVRKGYHLFLPCGSGGFCSTYYVK